MTPFQIADGLNVEANAAFSPNYVDFADAQQAAQNVHDFRRVTHCNGYANAFSVADGAPIPPLSANDQLAWLTSAPGWVELGTETEARSAALAGQPTYAVLYEPGHGHIGRVMPSPPSDPNRTYVSAAGVQLIKYDLLVRSFGDKKPRYFTNINKGI